MQFLYNIKQGIRNIIYWLPIIWRDRNWDYSHFLEILKHKLDAIRLDIPNWTCAGKEKEAENIDYAITLIDAIVNEEYECQAFLEHAQRWGTPKIVLEPISDNFSRGDFVYPDATDQKKAREHLTILLHDAANKRQAAIDILFDIIRDNFETWWD